ncbi:glycosyltransferase [Acutalibacter sp. 1XD8-33]|uniref:glycosyltransferase n=1 Tax=Acutalibacter sp. 1XD8-33 TaxID=2320081 RepID=UPI000EA1B591|nr:glycosyltransferase [Acutalibacter sp. 1XD8-33]RKJ41788.1 glycosyltransferase [Acutalibacter sp. 1XD8-33]
MKKILLVINTLGIGGAEKALLGLLARLDSREYQLSLYVLLGRGELAEKIPGHVQVLNRELSSGSVLNGAGRRAMAGAVARGFFRNGGCLGKLAYIGENFVRMVKKGRVQTDKLLWRTVAGGAERFSETYDLAVAWIEGGSAYYVAEHVRAKKKAAFIHIDYENAGYTREMDENCWEKFDRIFAVSEEAQTHFLKVYPEYAEKTGVIHNIVDQEEIRLRAQEPGGFSDDYPGFRLLTVGRLTYQKAIDVGIDAMKLLKDRSVSARWYVLGEGELRGTLERQIKVLGLENDFRLLGAVENPYPYYAQTDVYVHATRFEGRSIAIQEAQTLGRPVVASDCNGNRQQITPGVDGLLCPLEAEALAGVIEELLGDEGRRRALGDGARAKKVPAEDLGKLLELLE